MSPNLPAPVHPRLLNHARATESVLNRIAASQGRRDEAPNRELARELADQGDRDGIRELVANLDYANQNVRSDCLKTLYEVGCLRPELIAGYADEFLRLLHDRNNRMVWGSMLALSTIAPLRADDLFQHRTEIQAVMAEGSVITVDNGIKILATVAAADARYRDELFPFFAAPSRNHSPQGRTAAFRGHRASSGRSPRRRLYCGAGETDGGNVGLTSQSLEAGGQPGSAVWARDSRGEGGCMSTEAEHLSDAVRALCPTITGCSPRLRLRWPV